MTKIQRPLTCGKTLYAVIRVQWCTHVSVGERAASQCSQQKETELAHVEVTTLLAKFNANPRDDSVGNAPRKVHARRREPMHGAKV